MVVGAGAMGMAVAHRLAQRHRVLLADIDGDRAESEAAAMRDGGCDASAIACDVTSPEAVAALADAVSEQGGLGVLAHVAGLSPSAQDFHLIVRVNLLGAALVADALLPLARQGSAAILIASMAAHSFAAPEPVLEVLSEPNATDVAEKLAQAIGPESVNPGMAYAYSKQGLLLYARRNAAAWGAKGARIVSLSPGMIATPMGAREFEASEQKRKMFAASPLEREGTMPEIADAVEFLASDRASFISGTDLLVDGGLTAALKG
ncbi:MAG: SDR family oxidoreductase [Novosphingobium sp.]|nr:SDR family oxidoreductase [Novosphingobium sp.]